MNSALETVCLICTTVRTKAKNGTSFQKLLTELRRGFRNADFDLKIKSARKKFLTHDEFYVNAYYDAENEREKETPIEVIIYHNFDTEVVWDNQQVTSLLVQVFDAVVHEVKHQRQSRKRNFNQYWTHPDGRSDYHEYLQDPDEIDAYAFSIAIELCRALGKHRALRYMPRFTALARLKVQSVYASPNLNAYVSHFDKPKSPLLRRLAKKIYVRLQKVDTDVIFM